MGDGTRDCEPCDIALKARDAFGRRDLHGTLNGWKIVNSAGGSHLALELNHRAFENAHQWTRAELLGYRGHILHALRLVKSPHEARTLSPRATDEAPFGKDHCPRNHAESDQDEKYDFGDRARLEDEIEDFAADEDYKDGKEVHWDWEVLFAIIEQG